MKIADVPHGKRVHGDRDVIELESLGLAHTALLDFSVNLNPFGPPEFLLAALRGTDLSAYPDPRSVRAREALATSLGVGIEHVALGNGACELLWSLARLWPQGKAMVVEPTFSEFGAAMRTEGGVVHSYVCQQAEDFGWQLDSLSRAVSEQRPDVLYICNPNNPTGGFTALAQIDELAQRNPQVTFIIDESFLSLSDHAQALAEHTKSANLLRLRSVTKDFAIAGIRAGYVWGNPDLLVKLEARRPPWTVNAMAQAAIAASLRGDAFLQACRQQLRSLRMQLTQGLRTLGLTVLPSCVNFVLVQVPRAATHLRRDLLQRHHVVVRDASSFGLPGHIRLCVRPAADQIRLLTALQAELQAKTP